MSELTTIVIGDVHGNKDALMDILRRAGAIDDKFDRVPGFRIISVGDVVNCAPNGVRYRGFIPQDYETLLLVYSLNLIDEICVGNHELFYTHDRESGRFGGMAYAKHELHHELEPLMKEMVKEGIYKAATTAHGWLISHAGVAPPYQDSQFYSEIEQGEKNVEDWARMLNRFLAEGRADEIIDCAGWSVGGIGIGGVVWFRPDDLDINGSAFARIWSPGENPKRYKMSDNKLPQIVGHTIGKTNPMFFEPWNMWYIDSGRYVDGIGSGIIWNGESWEPIVKQDEEREVVEAV